VAGGIAITVLVENTVADERLLAEHGLAVWIECNAGRVLFDTGQGPALAPNAERLGVDLSTADAIALSHGHYDHTGGLPAALDAAPKATVYAHPAALDPKFAHSGEPRPRRIGMPPASAKALTRHKGRFAETTGPTEVMEGIFLTGEVPRVTDFEETGGPFFLDEACTLADRMLDDQALYFTSGEGPVLVVGCAHAGIVNTMRYVAELTGAGSFACVMGGMHLVGASDERIGRTIEAFRAFGVRRIGPAHCTGSEAGARFRQAFPASFFSCHAGCRLEFPRRGCSQRER
jgi:7,8-dihydropterin-6-yl-methyl-4-(beta-D-ribofuranosyl)aminobenzene 5'-phosphate synthase